MRAFLRFLIPCILLAGLLYVAKYMDSGRYMPRPPKDPPETTLSASENQPGFTESTQESVDPPVIGSVVETAPSNLLPVLQETLPDTDSSGESASEESLPEESLPEETQPQEVAPAESLPEQSLADESAALPIVRDADSIVITLLGDCTFGGTQELSYASMGFAKTVGDDYGYPFRNVLSYMESDDITLLNLEGPLCDKESPKPGGGFIFRGPESYVNILTRNSVDFVSLANNHIMDHGVRGYKATTSVLNEANIPFVETDSTCLHTLDNGVTIGLFGTMYGKDNMKNLVSQIQSLKEQGADLIIYVAHWGTEGGYRVNDDQRKLAHAAIDAGADLVYGSHPHVLQPIEEYNGGIIFYSMANFSFGGNTLPKDMDTALIQQTFRLQEDGSFALGERLIVPCCVSSEPNVNNYQPTPYAPGTPEYDRVMQKLNGTFTGPNLKIG